MNKRNLDTWRQIVWPLKCHVSLFFFLVLGHIKQEQTNLFLFNMTQQMKSQYLMDLNNAGVTVTLAKCYYDQFVVISKLFPYRHGQ